MGPQINGSFKCQFCAFEFSNNAVLDMHLKVVHNSLETKKPESTIVLNLEEFQINNSLEESNFNQGLDESYINQGLEDSRIQEMQVYQYEVLNEFNSGQGLENFNLQQNVTFEDGKFSNFEESKTIQGLEEYDVLQGLEKSHIAQSLNLFGEDEIPLSVVRNVQTIEGSNFVQNFDSSKIEQGFEESYIGEDLNESNLEQGLDNSYTGQDLDESKVGQSFGPLEKNKKRSSKLKKIHTTPSVECNICHEKFPSKVKWKNHMVMAHNKKKPFECEYCGHGSSTEANLNR